MSQLGEFLTGMVQRSHQGTQDRAALNTLAQFSDDQDSTATEKIAQRGKQASALRNVLKSYSDNPDLGHVLNGLGVDQLEGIMHGMAMNQAQQEMQSKMDESKAQTAWLNQRTTDAADEGDAGAQFAGELSKLLQPGGAPGAPGVNLPNTDLSAFAGYGGASAGNAPAPASPATNINGAALQAMAHMGKVNPKLAGIILNKILPSVMGGEDLTPGTFVDETTGAHFAYRGKQFQPAGYDPKMTGAGKPVPMTDPDGILMGFTMTDIKGHQTFHPYKGSATVKQVRDESGNALDGYFMDSQGHALDTRGAMEKAGYEMSKDADGNMKLTLKATKPTAKEYKSADEVKADFNAGTLTREAAKKILADKFNMK